MVTDFIDHRKFNKLVCAADKEGVKCKDCKYSIGAYRGCSSCTLTHIIVNPDKEHDCQCFNADLSQYNICYNCKYYLGGGDWGLFCSHKDMYHHIGKFNDEPCRHFERKEHGKQ